MGALFSFLHYNPATKPPHENAFRSQKHQLPLDRYVGTDWFFVTFCCEGRRKVFGGGAELGPAAVSSSAERRLTLR
jgi:hypothetical protein